MSRYHMSKKGEAAPCDASPGKCPLGGDHYDSLESAEAGIESRLTNEHSATEGITKSQAKSSSSFKAPDDESLDRAKRALGMSTTEVNAVKKLRDGKKVKDETLDTLIAERKGRLAGYSENEFRDNAEATLNYVKQERAKSGTPWSLHTVQSFDPSKESVFSNAQARSSAHVAGKAITREYANLEHAEERYREYSARNENEGIYSRKELDELRESSKERAANSKARVNAMLKEASWLMENEPKFSDTANPGLKSKLRQYKPEDSKPGVYLGKIKEVKS